MFIVNSSFGQTDCTQSLIFRRGRTVFAQHVHPSKEVFASLPIKIAGFVSTEAAEAALARIQYGLRAGKIFVDISDLEEDSGF